MIIAKIPREIESGGKSPIGIGIPRLRATLDPSLVNVGRGEEKLASAHNDKWAIRRADLLRAILNWNMSVPLDDLPLSELNDLFSNLFARAVKVDGTTYPSAALMNMMNAFNRIIRRASNLRSLGGEATRLRGIST